MINEKTIKIVERSWFFLKLPLYFLIFLLFIHTFFFTIFMVNGLSMSPTLKDRQILIVDKIYYLVNSPENGDIVILQFPGDPEKRIFVKRIVGLPETTLTPNQKDRFGEIASKTTTLAKGEYHVVGDNRQQSGDSRIWGSVPRENIIGRVIFIEKPSTKLLFFRWDTFVNNLAKLKNKLNYI